MRTIAGSVLEAQLSDETMQLVDCRETSAFLGVDPQAQVAGHFERALSAPFTSLFTSGGGFLLAPDELLELFTSAGVDFEKGCGSVVVVSSNISEAAATATALLLAGHPSVSFCTETLTDAFVESLPAACRKSIFPQSELLYVNDTGAFDLSPLDAALAQDEAALKAMDKEYAEYIKQKNSESKANKEEAEAKEKEEEIVWLHDGHRFFDMPRPVTRTEFLDVSRTIFRLVSFVLAPFGFPKALHERLTLSELKTRCGSLFQDVIEVCSDLVYAHKGLTEGAMAMSVHKWVEDKRDADCKDSVKTLNDLWDMLYEPPAIVEVPDVDQEHVVQIATQLGERLHEQVHKRAAWAFDEDETPEQESAGRTGWSCMYPGVVYALGFLPQAPKAKAHKKKLSTLQVKTFIQAAAEAIWDVVGERETFSQVEFQALCDALCSAETLAAIEYSSEDGLYILNHFLTQLSASSADDDLADKLVSVRAAVEDGNRKLRSGRGHVALASFAKAFDILPVFHKELDVVLVGRAKSFIEVGDLERARVDAQIALQLNPYSAGAYTCLGNVDEKLLNSEDAMQHYVTAFILDGSRSPEYAESIDRVSRTVGRQIAKDIFNAMVRVHELPSNWLVESYFDSFEHDADQRVRLPLDIAKSVVAAREELDAERLLHRGIFYKQTRNYVEAQADFARVVTLELADDAQRALALNLHASFLYVAGDVNAAVDCISQSLELDPTCVNSLVKKGSFLSELGDAEEAMSFFQQAVELDTNNADVHLHMGQMELLDGNYYRAVQCLRRAMTRSESLPVTHVSYGMALYKSGSIYQSNDVFAEAGKSFPESPEVHLFYGDVLADQGNYAEAMRHFLQAFELSPLCPLPFLNAGRVYVGTNDPMRAIAHFHQALEIDPRCSSAHLDIAQVLFAQGRTQEAMVHFDKAATCCRFLPEVEEVCACRAMAQMQLKVVEILGVDLRHVMRTK